MVDNSIRAYTFRAPRHQMLLFFITVLQNYPLLKYSTVTRVKEIKQLANKNNNAKVDQPKNGRKENIKAPPGSTCVIHVCNPCTNRICHKGLQKTLNERAAPYR